MTATVKTTAETNLEPTDEPTAGDAPTRGGQRTTFAPVSIANLTAVELRKMFDTRAGLWLLMSIGILAVLATAAVIAWAPDATLTYDAFGAAVGIPMAVILPIIAILSITSEYSQRTGLATYTLVPRRGRVISAKAIATTIVGVGGMLVALGVAALGNVVGAGLNGVDVVWDISLSQFGLIVLGNLLGMAIGFMLGVLLRNSPAAIVAYFVYSFVLPSAFGVLAALQEWFRDLQPWVDVNYTIGQLYSGQTMTGEMWTQLAVTSALWILLPLAIGIRLVMRSEVK